MKTLIVEADLTVRDLLVERLESRGHEVTPCADGERAWALCQQEVYPLVVLDRDLPGMDGLELCRKIRALPKGDGSFILVVTERGPSDALAEILEVGADDFLTRPIDTDLLDVRLAIAERDALALTGRRRREEAALQTDRRLSAVIANAPVGILALNPDGIIKHVKGKALESFGLPAAENVGRSVEALFGEESAIQESIRRTRRGVSSACVVERSGRRLEIRWSPELGPDGRVTGILGVVVGLSEVGPAIEGDDRADASRERPGFHGLLGQSAPMKLLFEQIREVALVDWTVLIEGETGSGKELVARAIHHTSARADKPFVAVNCGSLTESLLASQLFGHRRGAFTGAISDQEGLFEAAAGGSLFLDEIGEVSRAVQVSLLRALESREITRVGETRARTVDVRIIAATNRNLSEAVAEGTFRADLFYRLRIARLCLPPLRERTEDIPDLVWHFLDQSREATGKPIADIDPVAMDFLTRHNWPGNVRELKSAVDYAVLRCKGTVISRHELPAEVKGASDLASTPSSQELDPRERLLQALRRAHGNRTQAARLLGVSRATFYRYLARWGIEDEG